MAIVEKVQNTVMVMTRVRATASLVTRIVERAAYDGPRLVRLLGARNAVAYLWRVAINAPQMRNTRSLAPADFAMAGPYNARFHDVRLVLPIGEIDEATGAFDPTPVFGGVREMLLQDCYLRGFTSMPTGGAVLDLGGNRGLFDLVAATVLRADRVLSVEPEARFDDALQIILTANGVDASVVKRLHGFAAPAGSQSTDGPVVTIEGLAKDVPGGQFTFCKMDIEGGEFSLADEGVLFDRCETIAAEVHHFAGSVAKLTSQFIEAGFETALGDRFGRPCSPDDAEYIYASKVPGRVARGR